MRNIQLGKALGSSTKLNVQKSLKQTSAREIHERGVILYEKNTGKPYNIISDSVANGLKHYRLRCQETGKSLFLSTGGILSRFDSTPADGVSFGTLVLKRLTKFL